MRNCGSQSRARSPSSAILPALFSALLRDPPATTSVASSARRFASAPESTAVAGWLPSHNAAAAGRGDDLSLGFNAAPGASSLAAAGLWGPAASRHQAAAAAALGYGAMTAGDVGMVVFAPGGSSFHSHHQQRTAPDDPMFPLVAAAQRALGNDADATATAGSKPAAPGPAIQFWQPQPAGEAADGGSSPSGKKALAMQLDYGGGRGRADSGSGSGGATCHDCGNQAKKGCEHNRCRTCCNSRGFGCDTHVKSTWVPAARRRERQQLAGSPPPVSAAAAAKKPRLACQTTAAATNSRTSTSNATTPRSFDASSSHQDASFRETLPRQVRGPAVFRCVQVTSVDDGQREVAYQAAVTINGHLFRGLLYDLGSEDGRATSPAAAAVQLGTTSDLHLGSASAAHDLYSGGSGGPLILGGLGYGNTS
ncbi:hypothetical protein EJB05_35347, partial [Eragrostis curvula]